MARELAQRNDGDIVITLLWDTDAKGFNHTWIDVFTPQFGFENGHRVEIDPKLAFHAFTHPGVYVPEAWVR